MMIEIGNLRKEKLGEWTRLIVDISSDINRTDNETTMWIAVKNENEDMLTTDVYDAFLPLPLYMCMYYHTDLKIHGYVSKKLYYNINDYLQAILCSFSENLEPVSVMVQGFKEAAGEHKLIGTGISCGVDCLSTIYRWYELENEPAYKINALFMLNCGWNGDYYDEMTRKIFEKRCEINMSAAEHIGLSFYMVDSNLHCFLPQLDDQASFFSIYSCVLALEKAIGKYYISSSYSYGETVEFGTAARKRSFAEYADPVAIPLLSTGVCQLSSDGYQFKRTQKTENISDWKIAKKYLNVCCKNDSVENCSCCVKCTRTLLALEAMGKIDEYADSFDLKMWNKISYREKCKLAIDKRRNAFAVDLYDYCRKCGMKLPSTLSARLYFLPKYIKKIPIYVRRLINRKK